MLRNGSFEARTVCGRFLIGLTALLIAVSPWTEYYWHFDNFLRGGQDFEFGLLATILADHLGADRRSSHEGPADRRAHPWIVVILRGLNSGRA